MKRLKENKVDRVLDYLRINVESCIYLYIDLKTYRLRDENIVFRITEDSKGINTVLMRYYDSYQIFSAYKDWDIDEAFDIIEAEPATVISGPEKMIESLHKRNSDCFDPCYGIVINDETYRKLGLFSKVESATEDDADEIAMLMCLDDEFKDVYKPDNLAEQLRSRMNAGFGRSFVIRDKGKIVSHVATFAEVDDLAVISGLVADKTFKNTFYGLAVYEYIKMILTKEGKNIYALRYNDKMVKNAGLLKMHTCANFGKLIRKT